MSSEDASFQGPAPTRRFLRPGMRQATMILPKTGERVKRNFTLRDPFRQNGNVDD
ncbi:hypothetical protein LTS18_009406, partial [Coniosporium uncinatum]